MSDHKTPQHERYCPAAADRRPGAALVIALRRLARPAHRQAGPVAAVELKAIIGAGWAVADPRGAARLTAAGRTVLRRALSDGGAGSLAMAQPSAPVPKPAVNPSSVLRWLRQRRDRNGQPLLTAVQVEAGERLAADFVRGHMMPRVTAVWSPTSGNAPRRRGVPGQGVEMREAASAAQARFRAALAAAGPDFAGLLINVCCFDARIEDIERAQAWPQRSAKLLLQFGLNQLARHYGLIAQAPDAGTIRHAGSDGYRPTFDAWS